MSEPCEADQVAPLSRASWQEGRPDGVYECRGAGDGLVARCAVWRRGGDAAGEALGIAGHYEAADGASGAALLRHVCAALQGQGVRRVIGPMDGNTWRRYRFVTERGEHPPFFMEPDQPDRYVADWREAGFEVVAEYYSARCDDLTRHDPRLERLRPRLAEAGVVLRPLDAGAFERELERIHRLSLRAFADNYLYSPIDLASFKRMYSAVRDRLRPELVLLAEQGDELVGYVFALPDLKQLERGETVDTVIVKTIAVEPGRRCAGLGSLLMEEAHRAAHRLGFRRAIHALMHESNKSRAMSSRYARPFRRYALFGRETGA